ncbi:MAG: transporter substrate-binding domain-containing protein, partial [Pseudomonadota bacterium]
VVAAVIVPLSIAQAADTVVAANYPPIMIKGDPVRPGFAVEILQEAAKRSGREIDITFLPFKRAMQRVKTDTATLMPALFYGKSSNDEYLWLERIQSAKLTFATIGPRIDDLDTARSAAIVVENGSTPHVFLKSNGFQNLTVVSSPEASARMVQLGRVDAWMQSRSIVQQTWNDLAPSLPLTMGNVVHEIPIFMVASASLPEEMVTAYRSAVQSMRADGTLAEIWESYGLAPDDQ